MIDSLLTAEASTPEVDTYLYRLVSELYAHTRQPEPRASRVGAVVSDADQVNAILRNPDRFQKNYSLLAVIGPSRFSTNGPEWERRRDLTQSYYAQAGLPGNREAIAEAYAVALTRCDEASAHAIPRALMAASIKIFFLSFGRNVDTEPLLAFFDRARKTLKLLQYHSWASPRPEQLDGLRNAVRSLFADFEREIARAQELADLVQELQRAGEGIEKFSALNEMLMNFFAGMETTAATLSWAIDRLGVNARVEELLLAEVDADESPNLECFVNETLRYFPVVPFVTRQVAENTTIDGNTIPKGQLLVLSIVGVHHDRRFWTKPEVFDFSRAEFLNNTYDRRAFIPFVAGARTCGGARLARMQLIEGLKAFVRRFKVERDGYEIKFDYGLALRPNAWERVRISKRS